MKTRFCRNNRYATWLPLGIAIGTAIGVATDNLAVWVALGAGIGVALGAAQRDDRR